MPANRRLIHSDAKSIGDVLSGKAYTYKVPVYQRNYAWKDEQIDTLWDDITRALEEDQQEYFLGTVVVSYTEDSRKREIVDGQQRLATVSMIFSAIAAEWEERDDQKRADGVARDFLGSEDRRTGEIIPHLTLNEVNDSAFQAVIINRQSVEPSQRKSWEESNRLIEGAFRRIQDKLKKWLLGRPGDEKESLFDLEDFVSRKAKLIVIEAGDESDAFIIFETLNDRGLDLAVADLVKNYLFSKAGQNIEKFKKSWGDTVLLLGEQNMSQFLRHLWMSEYKVVRERELYREIRDKIKSNINARQFLEQIRNAANLYSALTNSEHDYWADFPPEAKTLLETLQLFNVVLFRPLALAVMKTWEPNDITRVLKDLVVISFRYNVISSLRAGDAEEVYSKAALAVNEGKVERPRDLFAELKSLYVDDDAFQRSFASKTFTTSRSKVPRYVLAELNDYLERNREKRVDSKTITLEHVLPRNPGDAWRPKIPANVDESVFLAEYITRIGNLTLLEKSVNIGVSNLPFEVKKEKAFSRSTLAINQSITQHTEWGAEQIEGRSTYLASIAKTIWRVDY